jgi:hypothetical protein
MPEPPLARSSASTTALRMGPLPVCTGVSRLTDVAGEVLTKILA